MLSISGLKVQEDELQMVALEMVRDSKGELVELKEFMRSQTKDVQAESPILAAFVVGFRVGRSGKLG